MNQAEQVVETKLDGQIGWICLNRPHRLNAVIPQLVEELYAAFEHFERAGARAVILSGRGRAFCAGHDLQSDTGTTDELKLRRELQKIQDVTRMIQRVPYPVIAAVNGYALGAGCEFALVCDLIIAAADARFGFPEVGVGLSVTGGISHLLPVTLGLVRAKELLFFGDMFTAEQAQSMGLINRVVALDELAQTAEDAARRLAQLPPLALARAKYALNRGIQSDMEAALQLEVEHAVAAIQSKEYSHTSGNFRKK